jgi:hypothetical protein
MQSFEHINMIPISLGYNCHVRVFIDRIGEIQKRTYLHQPFDWVGSPMWSVYEAVKANFSGFADRSSISLRKRFTDKPDEYLTHSVYNLCFLHDFGKDIRNVSEEKWNEVQEKYIRRIDRWNNTLAKKEPILFIRLEPDRANRIEYPEFQREADEKSYVERFAELMQTKGISYTILFLSTTYPKHYDPDRRICTVNFVKKRPADIIGADHIQQIVMGNLDFIHTCLRK